MNNLRKAKKYTARRRKHSVWRNAVTAIAAVVVFCTTYALILPAITAETPAASCGLEEHTHEDSCWELSCTREDPADHVHKASCYAANGLVCQQDHTHEGSCYSPDSLICPVHLHSDNCYGQVETFICGEEEREPRMEELTEEEMAQGVQPEVIDPGHTHSDDCRKTTTGLICGKTETERHTHTLESCYRLVCGMEEHEHSALCVENADKRLLGIAPLALGEANLSDSQYHLAVSGSGTQFHPNPVNPEEAFYTTDLSLNFQLTPLTEGGLADYDYYLDLKDVVVPEGVIAQGKHWPLMDGDRECGYYYFEKDDSGKVTLHAHVDEDYAAGSTKPINGKIKFSGTLGAEKRDDNGSVIAEITKDITVTIPPEEIEYPGNEGVYSDLDVQKGGFFTLEGNKLQYTVYVDSLMGTQANIELHDVLSMPAGMPVKNGTVVSVEKKMMQWGGHADSDPAEPVSGYTASFQNLAEGYTMDMTLPALPKGEVGEYGVVNKSYYKIVYTYEADFDVSSVNIKPENKIETKSNDEQHHELVTDRDSCIITISNNVSFTKSGAVEGGEIVWTIKVNEGGSHNVAGATITDAMLSQMVADSLTFSPEENISLGDDGAIHITGGEDGTNHNAYTITYRTPVPVDTSSDKVTNEAEYQPESGSSTGAEGTVTIPVSTLEKTHGDYYSQTVDGVQRIVTNWTVTYTPGPGSLSKTEPTEILDTLSFNDWETAPTHWVDKDSVSLCYVDENDVSGWIDPEYYDVAFYANKAAAQDKTPLADGQVPGCFVLTMKPEIAQHHADGNKLKLTYRTIGNYPTGYTNYVNGAYVKNLEKWDSFALTPTTITKTDKTGHGGTSETINKTGELTWKVNVAVGSLKDVKAVHLQDNLPAGITLTELRVGSTTDSILNGTTIYGDYDGCHYEGTYNQETGVVLVDITAAEDIPAGKNLALTYVCQVNPGDDGALPQQGTYPNSVTFTTESSGSSETGTASQTQNWKYGTPPDDPSMKKLEKNGVFDSDRQRFDFKVLVNAGGQDLLENSDTLILSDTLTYKHGEENKTYDLVHDSVKLYNAVPDTDGSMTLGTEVSGWTNWVYYVDTSNVTSDNYQTADIKNTLTATIPDETPLFLVYSYKLNVNPKAMEGKQYGISNTATLYGNSDQTSGYENNNDWIKAETTGELDRGEGYFFTKVESGHNSIILPGAVFTVYSCGQNPTQDPVAFTSYTTDEKGTFLITAEDTSREYLRNTLYMVKETKAPAGYSLPESVLEYWFYFGDSTAEGYWDFVNTAKSVGAIDLMKQDKVVYAENVNNSTQIMVQKQWVDQSGNTVKAPVNSIGFELWQTASSDGPSVNTGNQGGVSDSSHKIAVSLHLGYGSPICQFTCDKGDQLVLNFRVPSGYAYYDRSGGSLWVEHPGKVISLTLNMDDPYDENEFHFLMLDLSQRDQFSYQIVKNPGGGGGEGETTTQKFADFTISAENNWRWSSAQDNLLLPLTGYNESNEKVWYTYSIKEKSSTYDVQYTNNAGITSGTITATNTVTQFPVRLPETGGIGTTLFTTTGLALSMGAALGLANKTKRKRGKAADKA